MQKLRYYAAGDEKKPDEILPQAFHSEFLRTGRISRDGARWLVEQRRYLSYEEVAEATGRKLDAAAATTHKRINSFHRAIRFPKLIFHRTLSERPHLGYCHVTAAKTDFAKFADVRWSFYIANFFAEIGDGEHFFEHIRPQYSRMYFAVALQPNKTDKVDKKLLIDRTIRKNGLLFRTQDPKEAFRNVLMLGAKTPELRKTVAKVFEANPTLMAAE
ncbi:DUF6656 family protein [Rhizobium sp. RU36D]|uniref:DUF6656 family protein n=1 Tax=Rhizobium sp. RU36D TaxID=1907415 RepID=UPI0009D8EC04|nr:DUF6656 family protein [Rhizobium sp. RU36D]SMC92094.1 hypothetical protein SAMN05880593_110108 [Rhizobium sp. RU36D]